MQTGAARLTFSGLKDPLKAMCSVQGRAGAGHAEARAGHADLRVGHAEARAKVMRSVQKQGQGMQN